MGLCNRRYTMLGDQSAKLRWCGESTLRTLVEEGEVRY